ncbi:hypothetical protein E2C01_052844 [Portunus trituberculatus]|uniref:Uncharacterized protein n=1 Tax=Portunus trituberculatus TaxID=210409 RepID=A0A5B7GQF6_PORTR|nr:hypothetical protein [Portunus trituberculatus]
MYRASGSCDGVLGQLYGCVGCLHGAAFVRSAGGPCIAGCASCSDRELLERRKTRKAQRFTYLIIYKRPRLDHSGY